MISFPCPQCTKPLKVKDELAGKRVKCPACGQPIAVPAASENLTAAGTDAGKRSPVPVSGPISGAERTLPPKSPVALPVPSSNLVLPPAGYKVFSMPSIHPWPPDVGAPAPGRLPHILEEFREAWSRTSGPALESFLPTESEERFTVLVALFRSDMEFLSLGLALRLLNRQKFGCDCPGSPTDRSHTGHDHFLNPSGEPKIPARTAWSVAPEASFPTHQASP